MQIRFDLRQLLACIGFAAVAFALIAFVLNNYEDILRTSRLDVWTAIAFASGFLSCGITVLFGWKKALFGFVIGLLIIPILNVLFVIAVLSWMFLNGKSFLG